MTSAQSEWVQFGAALVVFLASHSLPARPALRRMLRERLGGRTYMILYSIVSLAVFAWLIRAAEHAPLIPLWNFEPWQLWVPNIVMPFVCLLIAFGFASPDPFSLTGRNGAAFDPRRPGMAGITRHPILWAVTLWAAAHLVPNGDLAHYHPVRAVRGVRPRGHGPVRRPQAARMGAGPLGGANRAHIPAALRGRSGRPVQRSRFARPAFDPACRARPLSFADVAASVCYRRIAAAKLLSLKKASTAKLMPAFIKLQIIAIAEQVLYFTFRDDVQEYHLCYLWLHKQQPWRRAKLAQADGSRS